jgi:predicted Zn-dependent protease with MMP-like domain
MERARFLWLVRRALQELPPRYRARLENVDIVVKRRMSPHERREAGLGPDEDPYGLYQGVPLTERTSDYGLVLPDVITIYQEPLEEDFPDEEDLVRQIQITVMHEIAHFFGIDDERLEALGLD